MNLNEFISGKTKQASALTQEALNSLTGQVAAIPGSFASLKEGWRYGKEYAKDIGSIHGNIYGLGGAIAGNTAGSIAGLGTAAIPSILTGGNPLVTGVTSNIGSYYVANKLKERTAAIVAKREAAQAAIEAELKAKHLSELKHKAMVAAGIGLGGAATLGGGYALYSNNQ